jgi:hypothetical protein
MAISYDIIDKLISDREAFNKFVYTQFNEAIIESEKRRINPITIGDLEIPIILKDSSSFVLFRHIATPNYEIRRFISIADAADNRPIILEYASDIFRSINPWKSSLAKIPFYKGTDKYGKIRVEYKNIIDFNISNSKPFSQINTLWNQKLVDFHHEFFIKHFPAHKDNILDLSDWLKRNGNNPKEYYKTFLYLFLNNGILFENFLLEGQELEFTKKFILPAIIDIINETGHKPLIVALEPTEIEDDLFWLCHPIEEKEFVKNKAINKE